MPKRVITAAVGVAGLVVIGLGVASATLWRADDVLVATTPASSHLVVTDPGVLELGGDPATISATTSGGDPVVIAVGRDTDVDGWVGTDAHAQVTGLSSWDHLAVTDVPAGPAPTPSASASATTTPSSSPSASKSPSPSSTKKASATPSSTKKASATPTPSETAAATTGDGADQASGRPDPTDSDLWVAQATGDGSAKLVWPAQEGRWSLLVAGTGDSAPALSIAWPRVVTTPWLWPLVILGSILALGAAALLARDWNRRRTGNLEPEWHSVTTGAIAAVGESTAGLTRRQIREAELARSARPRTGSTPQVATPTGAPQEPGSSEAPSVEAGSVVSPPVVPTTRRALRTGAIPTVPAPTATQPTEKPAPTAAQADAGTQVFPVVPADDRPTVPVDLRPADQGTGTPGTADDHRPTWLRGRSGTDVTGRTDSAPAAASAAPTAAVPTVSQPPVTPSSASAPAWVPVATTDPEHGSRPTHRPAWLPVSSEHHPADGPAAPAGQAAPAAETNGEGQPTDPQPGSRADAWRRAWGLPSTDEHETEMPEEER